MIKRTLLILFVCLLGAVLYRLFVPPTLPFEIYPAPYTIFTFGVIRNDSGEISSIRNTYIVKGYSSVPEEELKHRLDSFTCTVLPDTLSDKGTYHVSFYRYSSRTQDKYLSGPLAEDISFWAKKDYLMSYSFNKDAPSNMSVSSELMPNSFAKIGLVTIVDDDVCRQ